MNDDHLSDKPVAPLSGSLLARKGSANASGFAVPPVAVPPAPALTTVVPADHGAAQPCNSAIAPSRDGPAHANILIVEDDFLNRQLMTDLLEAHGYATLQTDNGYDAILMARAEEPDLIVMDIQLPKLSGLDAIRQLKSDGDLRDIPVIAVSAMGRSAAEGMIAGAGFDEFLAKPFTISSVLHTVSRFLH